MGEGEGVWGGGGGGRDSVHTVCTGLHVISCTQL